MLFLIFDEAGAAVGSGSVDITGDAAVPRLTEFQVECSPAQAANPKGFRFSGGKIVAAPAAPAVVVIPDVSATQALVQLSRTKGSDGVSLARKLSDLMAKLPDDDERRIYYTRAQTWQRRNQYVIAIGKSLDLSDEDMDKLFSEAAKIAG